MGTSLVIFSVLSICFILFTAFVLRSKPMEDFNDKIHENEKINRNDL